ncbi:hypothetical protein V5799_025333 [Amblyomma americanum]|uniref:Peptidase A2 domain-containing protein n=1 Tax=Amblyomma americanum TaxID=6943 RepID=A0AAQ4E9V6_AMBAM
MILDTGASANIASQRFISRIDAQVSGTKATLRNVNGKLVSAAGEVTLNVRIGPVELQESFLVLDTLPCELLGEVPLCGNSKMVISFPMRIVIQKVSVEWNLPMLGVNGNVPEEPISRRQVRGVNRNEVLYTGW